MRKINYMNETPRLISRWVMLLAYNLMEKEDLSRSVAMKQAHQTERLLDLLGKGVVKFAYWKEDDTERIAVGTLCKGIDPAFDNYESKGNGKRRDNSNTEGIYTYWDLERHAFRTFKALNLIDVKCK